jgi:hypothetical protein
MRADLAALPPVTKMSDKIDVAERFMYLDCVSTVARDGFDVLFGLAGGEAKANPKNHTLLEIIGRHSIDWDLVLRSGNPWYDRMVAAGRKPTRSERQRELDKIDKDLKKLIYASRDPESMAMSVLNRGPRKAASQQIADMFVGLLMPAVSACFSAEDRSEMQSGVTRLGFALAAYHADHGSYPQRLSELTPGYVAKVPNDIFAADGVLHYQRQGAGYLLYSVGPNGHDDGGRTRDECKEGEGWDDIVMRVP